MFKIVALVLIGILAAIGFFELGQAAYILAAVCSASVPSWTTAERVRRADGYYRGSAYTENPTHLPLPKVAFIGNFRQRI